MKRKSILIGLILCGTLFLCSCTTQSEGSLTINSKSSSVISTKSSEEQVESTPEEETSEIAYFNPPSFYPLIDVDDKALLEKVDIATQKTDGLISLEAILLEQKEMKSTELKLGCFMVYNAGFVDNFGLTADEIAQAEKKYGSSNVYIKKGSVLKEISKIFCEDCENITFDDMEKYSVNDELLSIMATGREHSQTALLRKLTQTENQVEAVISYVYFTDSQLYSYRGNDVIGKIGDDKKFNITKEKLGTIPQIRFTFCKYGDSLKIHSIKYE